MTNHATLTALAEKLEAVRPHLWAHPAAPVVDEAIATLRSLAAGGEGQRKPTTLSGECPCDGPTRIAPDCPHHGTKARTAGQGHAATPASEVRISVEAAQSNPARDLAYPPPFPALRQEPTNCKHEALHAETGHVASCFPPAALDREALVKLEMEWRDKGNRELAEAADTGKTYAAVCAAMRLHCADALLALLRPAPVSEEP